jgi:Ca2+:H+ antiporter
MRWSILISGALFLVTLLLILIDLPLYVTFIFIILTLIFGSRMLGDATEEFANYYSSTLGGLMNATLGNLPELIIGFFALKAGLVEVVKASLTGSIIGNVLLVFGMAALIGGFKYKELKFTRHESNISSTMLLIASFLLLLPSILFLFHEEKYNVNISYFVAFALFLLYIGSIIFSFFTHKEYFAVGNHEKPKMKKSHALLLMIASIIILSIVSELFASRLEIVAEGLHWGELFIGAILVGVVGNAAEHLSVIQFARKNKASLVLNTAIGSSLQIAMFVAPVLVLISILVGNVMSLAFLPIEIVAIVLSAFLVNEISKDDSINWLEGAQLVLLYLVLAIIFFFYG